MIDVSLAPSELKAKKKKLWQEKERLEKSIATSRTRIQVIEEDIATIEDLENQRILHAYRITPDELKELLALRDKDNARFTKGGTTDET